MTCYPLAPSAPSELITAATSPLPRHITRGYVGYDDIVRPCAGGGSNISQFVDSLKCDPFKAACVLASRTSLFVRSQTSPEIYASFFYSD